MKHIKKLFLLFLAFLTVFSTIKSLNAEEGYTIEKVTPITNKSLELKLNKDINLNDGVLTSDFKMYKDIKYEKIIKDQNNSKKITVDIKSIFEKKSSYSILLISGAEGSIEFKTENNFIGKEIKNQNLEELQGIEKIIIKEENKIEIYFLQNLVSEDDIDLKIYKDVYIDKTIKNNNNLNILLKTSLENNSQYISTLTLLEDNNGKKINIENGIYDFNTETLKEYNGELDNINTAKTDKNTKTGDKDESLEDKLLNALEETKIENNNNDKILGEEKEISDELNSASEDPKNKEPTQLEKLALKTKETPDTGAETWVLILGTFIINTFYFLSRRKK